MLRRLLYLPCRQLMQANQYIMSFWFLQLRWSRGSHTVLLLLLAPALYAGQVRMEFIARAGGQRVAGAEVCFFKAGFGPGPVDKFAGEDLRCLPADQVIEMP